MSEDYQINKETESLINKLKADSKEIKVDKNKNLMKYLKNEDVNTAYLVLGEELSQIADNVNQKSDIPYEIKINSIHDGFINSVEIVIKDEYKEKKEYQKIHNELEKFKANFYKFEEFTKVANSFENIIRIMNEEEKIIKNVNLTKKYTISLTINQHLYGNEKSLMLLGKQEELIRELSKVLELPSADNLVRKFAESYAIALQNKLLDCAEVYTKTMTDFGNAEMNTNYLLSDNEENNEENSKVSILMWKEMQEFLNIKKIFEEITQPFFIERINKDFFNLFITCSQQLSEIKKVSSFKNNTNKEILSFAALLFIGAKKSSDDTLERKGLMLFEEHFKNIGRQKIDHYEFSLIKNGMENSFRDYQEFTELVNVMDKIITEKYEKKEEVNTENKEKKGMGFISNIKNIINKRRVLLMKKITSFKKKN